MGTNYYLHEKPDCETCGRPHEPMHIGKSSGGWCFALHIMPDDGITTLDHWRALWSRPGAFIRNEYGEVISKNDMEGIITERGGGRGETLRRHDIDGLHCSGHGPGTWDYLPGEFS